jgi:hypothetical protein
MAPYRGADCRDSHVWHVYNLADVQIDRDSGKALACSRMKL